MTLSRKIPTHRGRRDAQRRITLRYLSIPFAVGLLAACSRPFAFKGTDISGSPLTMSVTLTDQNGRRRTLSDFRGKVVAVFLGYTHCPDVCPATMGELKLAMQQIGQTADQVQVLFVSVDPKRDTPQVLAHWVASFDPRFLGLRGTPDELHTLANQLKVFYRPAQQPTSDEIMHNGNVFLFDRHGHIRVLEQAGVGAHTLATDIGLLLGET